MKVNVTGGWVELRAVDEVPERLRRPIVDVTFAGVTLKDGIDKMEADPQAEVDPEFVATLLSFSRQFGDLAAVAFVKEWSFPEPVTLESIQNLPGKVFDEIQAAVGPLANELLPSFQPTKESVADPKAPTDS